MGLGEVIIAVADTGLGIGDEVREKVFDPFVTTKELGKGTGLGLTIVRSIVVDRHGGAISFATERGRGTTFTVRLPIRLSERPLSSAGEVKVEGCMTADGLVVETRSRELRAQFTASTYDRADRFFGLLMMAELATWLFLGLTGPPGAPRSSLPPIALPVLGP